MTDTTPPADDSDKPRVQIRPRIAIMCPKEECGWREFGNPDAKCPTHGKGVVQPNRPYFGRPT